MKRNSRLFLALHSVSHMARDPERMWTSAEIAEHAGTNPVVVRRVLGKLRAADLLVSEKGHSGGWRLKRSPNQITLADIYVAIDDRLISMSIDNEKLECAVEGAVQNNIARVFEEVENEILEKFQQMKISDLEKAASQNSEN